MAAFIMALLQWVQLCFSLPLVCIAIHIFIIIITTFFLKTRGKKYNIPPGPFRLPVIGHIHLLLGSMPHISLRDLAVKYGPIYSLTLGRVPLVMVSSPRLAREVFRTRDLELANRPRLLSTEVLFYGSTSVGFVPYGPLWRTLRKLCINELLSPRRVKSYTDIRREEVERMIHRISTVSGTGMAVDLTRMLVWYTNGQIFRSAFGREFIESKDYDGHGMERLLHDYHVLLGGFSIAEYYPSMNWLARVTGTHSLMWETRKRLDDFLSEVIDRRCRNGKLEKESSDFLDALLHLQEEEEEEGITLTTDNIKANILTIFAAGTSTTSTVVDWAMTELLLNPETMKRAQEEIDQVMVERKKERVSERDLERMEYLKAVVKETLRLHPPVPLLLPRVASEDTVIGEYDIPAGTRVYVNAWAIGRDPEVWEDPEIFKPERFLFLLGSRSTSSIDFKGQDFELIPFGSGRRACPGINFAMAAVELALAELLHSFHWELPHSNLPLNEVFGISIYKKVHLKLVPKPRREISLLPPNEPQAVRYPHT